MSENGLRLQPLFIIFVVTRLCTGAAYKGSMCTVGEVVFDSGATI